MARLSDDCFAFRGTLLTIEAAQKLMMDRVPPVEGSETANLAGALGRVTAEEISSPIALPSFENAAVDGYAVRHADIGAAGDTRLRIVERVYAGDRPLKGIGAGEAARIFTGAPLPAGADTIYMQEDCRVETGMLIVPPGLKAGANKRSVGEDLQKGVVAIPSGRRLKPQDLALLAAIGIGRLKLKRRVRVALFSTGDEITEPGNPLSSAGVYDANRFLLLGLLQKFGAEMTDLGIIPDDPKLLEVAIGNAANTHDLVLTSGGVSTGEADHVKSAVERIGKLVFWRIAIKPGHPVAMGVIRGAAFVGLPGNPVAVFATFAQVVRPLLLRRAGASPEPLLPLPVRAAFSHGKKKNRREYVRVSLRRAADGTVEAVKFAQDGAAMITSLTETDGLVELPDDKTSVEPGETLNFISYASLFG